MRFPIIKYPRYLDRRPYGCIYMIDADHIGWTMCNPTDRWNRKLARDGGPLKVNIHYEKALGLFFDEMYVEGAKERARKCGWHDLEYIDQIPNNQYGHGEWRRQAIEREVFIMRKWAQAREAK